LKTKHIETLKQEKRVRFVVLFTLLIIAIEVIVGITSHSMALLADAIHLSSHELILGLNWAAYLLVRRLQNKQSENYDTSKILSLSALVAVKTAGMLCSRKNCKVCSSISAGSRRISINKNTVLSVERVVQ